MRTFFIISVALALSACNLYFDDDATPRGKPGSGNSHDAGSGPVSDAGGWWPDDANLDDGGGWWPDDAATSDGGLPADDGGVPCEDGGGRYPLDAGP